MNQTLARRHVGERDALGARISLDGGKTWRTIVGVVADVRQGFLSDEPREIVYLPFIPTFSWTLFVRTSGEPLALTPGVRAILGHLDPHAAVRRVRTLEQIHDAAIDSPRLTAALLGLFGTLALAISATGVGGVVAYTVSRRTQEIGIRMALGSTPSRILGAVLKQSLLSVGVGTGLGLVGALALSRLLSGLLFDVRPADPVSFAVSTVILLLTATIACFLPARRAMLLDPSSALRRE